MWGVRGTLEVNTWFWWEGRREGPGVGGRITFKWLFKTLYGEVWTGFLWLRIGTDGGRL